MENCSSEVPAADVYLSQLQTGYIVAFSLLGVVVLAVLILYVEQMIFFFRHLGEWKPRDKAIWLIGIYPVFCLTSFIALLAPRTSMLDRLVSLIYLSLCVYLFVTMLIGHYGGAKAMAVRLTDHPIPLRDPPCCCLVCVPRFLETTTGRLQALSTAVLQYAVLIPITSYISALLAADGKFQMEDLGWTSPYLYVSLINLVSTIIALWGFLLVFKISHAKLVKMCIKPKFVCLQLVIMIANMQHLLVAIFVVTGVVPCEPPLNAKANGDRWNNMVIIVEMLFIAIAARSYYKRHVGELQSDELVDSDVDVNGGEEVKTEPAHNLDTFPNGSLIYDQTGIATLPVTEEPASRKSNSYTKQVNDPLDADLSGGIKTVPYFSTGGSVPSILTEADDSDIRAIHLDVNMGDSSI